MEARATVGLGTRLMRDGEVCEVVALEGDAVVVQDSRAHLARVRVGDLFTTSGAGGLRLLEAPAGKAAALREPVGVLLDTCGDQVVARALERAAHVREVLSGYRSGSSEIAAPGEPRPEFSRDVPLMARYRAKGEELGVAARTVREWVDAYRAEGEAGLLDAAASRRHGPMAALDARWVDACRAVLDDQVQESNVTKSLTLRRVRARLDRDFGEGTVPAPQGGTAYRMLDEVARGRGSFGASAKARRSIANRPAMSYGRLRATRPGEYVLLDTTRLDVFAMEPVTLRWVQVELTIAIDLFDRCVTGLRCSPVSTKSVDVASVLFETIQPREVPADAPDAAVWPYHGMPGTVVVDADRVEGPRFAGPGLLPDAIVVDHGRVYVSAHVTSACARLGISIQPARPYTPTDKAVVERFFRTLREGLLEVLPGYKGPDVFSRGADVEADAFFYLGELEAIMREWVSVVYHRRPHDSLVDPRLPGLKMSPLQRFSHGIARAGRIDIPRDGQLALQLLPLRWRTIQHYGVEIDGLRYSGPIVGKYADRTSGYKSPGNFHGARKGGRWPFAVNPDDLRRIYFRDPDDGVWHTLDWEHAADLDLPLSADALIYAKRLAASGESTPDTARALADLLAAWNIGLAGNRTERRIALRMAAERSALEVPAPSPRNDLAQLSTARDVMAAQHQDGDVRTAVQAADAQAPAPQDDSDDDSDDDELDDGELDDEQQDGGLDFYAGALEVME